jgi:hypothetical protein
MSSNYSADGAYLAEDGHMYKMHNLVCSAEAKENVLDRIERLKGDVIVIAERPCAFLDGSIGIDYCKKIS